MSNDFEETGLSEDDILVLNFEKNILLPNELSFLLQKRLKIEEKILILNKKIASKGIFFCSEPDCNDILKKKNKLVEESCLLALKISTIRSELS